MTTSSVGINNYKIFEVVILQDIYKHSDITGK